MAERRTTALSEWLTQANERLDPFMAFLGVLFALLVGFEIAVDVDPQTARFLRAAGWAIWGAFVVEFALELAAAPDRGAFLRRSWFRVLAILLPTLRLIRFLRLLRVGRAFPAARVFASSYRVTGTAARVFRSRLGYLAALTTIVVVALAQLAYLFERDRAGFSHLGDALLWAAAVVVGQHAVPQPETAAGRAVMVAGFAFGIVVFATLAGALGALFVEQRAERAAAEEGQAVA